MARDFYSILDIPPGTDKEGIRQAFLRLARTYHPDLNRAPEAEKQFEEIHQAYTILSDDEARLFYNLYYEGMIGHELDDVYVYQSMLPWQEQHGISLSIVLLVAIILVSYLVGISLPVLIEKVSILPDLILRIMNPAKMCL
jgi:curved DNA-binding protein CbpA